MSHIPNSAMPHAAPHPEQEPVIEEVTLKDRARKVAETARANPKTAIAAGAALLAGAVAAAAIPIVKARRTPAAKKPTAKPRTAKTTAAKPARAKTTRAKPTKA